MPLELWTAQYSLPDRDRLDITRAGVDRAIAAGKPAPGAILAPSAGLVFPTLRALRAAATEDERAEIWRRYKAAYLAEVRATYRRDRTPFDDLLARERLVFACFCAGKDVVRQKRCHRYIAAEDVFAKLGAVYRGELRAEDAVLVGRKMLMGEQGATG